MSYSPHKYEALRRLGVEQLPTLREPTQHSHYDTQRRCSESSDSDSEPRLSFESDDSRSPFAMSMPIRERPVPGRRCPNCLARGQTFWVVPGKRCSQCGTEVN